PRDAPHLRGERDLGHEPDPRALPVPRRGLGRARQIPHALQDQADRLRAVWLRGDARRPAGDQTCRRGGNQSPRAVEVLLPRPRSDRRRARPLHDQRLRRQLATELRRLSRDPLRPAPAGAPGRPPRPPRARAAGLLFTLAAVLAGCGTTGTVQGGNDALSSTTLTVYSDLPP